ncbi:hypothetical protein B0H17DRAFT_1127109 [Mycena rosella]|uniref:Uncharacterized protein n=1 Tax=Mycena rosella TaxID=1033263 RepID=A0AAD7GSB0_MYCRO|nr:hypothetical protein B0H17DRAFT_1127109 [Mycena rosella]
MSAVAPVKFAHTALELLVNASDSAAAFEVDPELVRTAPMESDGANEGTEALETPSDDAAEDFEDVFKASILKDLMQKRSPRISTDRTKRVAEMPAFANQSTDSHIAFDNPTGAPSLRIGNPMARILECDGRELLAVSKVNNIILGSRAMDSIILDLLSDRATEVSYQILQLVSADSESEDARMEKRPRLFYPPVESHRLEQSPGEAYLFLEPSIDHGRRQHRQPTSAASLRRDPHIAVLEKLVYTSS